MIDKNEKIKWDMLVLLCLPTLSILLSTNIVITALSNINLAFKGIEGTADLEEGVRSFLEKRPPQWKAR